MRFPLQTEPEDPGAETARIEATIARLRSEQERALAQGRPAMAHACELLIALQLGRLPARPAGGAAPAA